MKQERMSKNSKNQVYKRLWKPIICYICLQLGGTLIKDENGYRHENCKYGGY